MSDPQTRVFESLAALGAEFERVACDPALADTAAFCEHYGYPLAMAANTIVVASKKQPRDFAVCVVLATTRLDVNRAVRTELGVGRLSFASEAEMRTVTGMELGGVTPFALPPDLPLLVDERVLACDQVILGTGGRTSKILLSPAVLLRLPLARSARITRP